VTPHCPDLPHQRKSDQPPQGLPPAQPSQPMGPDNAYAVLPAHAPPPPVGLSLLASPENEKLLYFSVCKFLRVVLLFVP
jgi:hypothetical protein